MYAFRCTEQQLNDSLKQIEEAGDTLFSAEFKGGRDWMLFCHKASATSAPNRVEEAALRAIAEIRHAALKVTAEVGHAVDKAVEQRNRQAKP